MTTTVEQTFSVPVKKLFSAWADTEHLSKWFTMNAVQDFRVGGKYYNNDKDEGVFLEIIPDKKIRFTWDNKAHCPGTEVTLDFYANGDGNSSLKITHDKLESEKHVKEMNTGWSWAVYSLKSYLETGKAVPYGEWEKLMKVRHE